MYPGLGWAEEQYLGTSPTMMMGCAGDTGRQLLLTDEGSTDLPKHSLHTLL